MTNVNKKHIRRSSKRDRQNSYYWTKETSILSYMAFLIKADGAEISKDKVEIH